MSYQRWLFLATVCAVGAFLALVLRIAHPHHRQLALLIYGIGWVPFALSIRKLYVTYPGQAQQILRWKIHILVGIVFLIFAWTFKVLIPVERSPLLAVDMAQLPASLEADLQHLAFIDAKMQEVATELYESPVITAPQIATADAKKLRADWARFLEASFELDLIKMRYRAFYQVNGFRHPRLHAKAFVIGYGALVSQYRAALIVMAQIDKYETAKRLLDDAQPELGIPAGSFSRVQLMISHPDEILRLNAGRAYLLLMQSRLEDDDPAVCRAQLQLAEITDLALTNVSALVNNPLDVLEHKASNAWFPVQKGVALGMASIRTVSRRYFISPADLKSAEQALMPGDIMLTRREWHLTNLGIPGYWTHAALHIGTLEQMDRYFDELPLLNGRAPSAVIRDRFPQVYAALCQKDATGGLPSVIEALRPGVIVQTLEASATADSLAVLRPKVSRADRWQAVVAALSHYGKPYNYDFDFRIDSALVCSQLVYKAYETIAGLHLEPTMSSGRLLLSPNELAIKYDREMAGDNSEFELVLFLDGINVGEVLNRSAEDFRSSWSRPKWHIVFQ